FLLYRRPPLSPLFPYTTLFRSAFSFFGFAMLFLPKGIWPPRRGGPPALEVPRAESAPRAPRTIRGPRGATSRRKAESPAATGERDRKSTRLNSSHLGISYAVFC